MSERFRHKLRFFPLVALIFGSLAGGPFGIEAMLPTTGPGMSFVLLLLAALVWCVPMILVSSELGSAIPVEGGYYRWTRRGLGDFWGFQAGWWVWLSSLLDEAMYPVLMVSFLERFVWPGIREPVVWIGPVPFQWLNWLLCMALIVPCCIINLRGARSVGLTSVVLGALILGPYVPFVLLALAQGTHSPFTPLVPPGQGVLDTLGYGLLLAMWSYSGYELPSTISEEVENPSSTLPKALFTALPLVTLAYLLPLGSALAVRTDWEHWSEGTFVDAAHQIGEVVAGGGAILASLITLATVAGSVSLFNGLLMPYTRIQFAMAEDRFLPGVLADLHPRYSTPRVSILFNCTLYSILVMFPFQNLLTVGTWLILPAYPLVYLSFVVLRLREPHLRRPFRLRGGRWGLALVALPPCVLAAFAIWNSAAELLRAPSHRLFWIGIACVSSGPLAYWAALVLHARRGTRPLPLALTPGAPDALRQVEAEDPSGAPDPRAHDNLPPIHDHSRSGEEI